MKEYPAYTAAPQDVIDLLASQRLARIVTIDPDGIPRIGLHVFIHDGLDVEIHMALGDEQFADIKRGSPVVVEIDEPLASAASHWVDPADATNADQFYRCASFWGPVEIATEADAIARHLAGILRRYQPEGKHEPVHPEHPFYKAPIGMLALVRVRGASIRSKFKLAQTTESDSRQRILHGLRGRGSELDRRTADLIDGASD